MVEENNNPQEFGTLKTILSFKINKYKNKQQNSGSALFIQS